MKMKYFIAIIETDTDKLDEKIGMHLLKQMAELKVQIDKIGECAYYQVTDEKALRDFKANIKRLNP